MGRRRPLEIDKELLDAFDHAMRVTEYLTAAVPEELWHAPPIAKGRTVAAIVAHIHSLRRTFTKMGGADVGPTLKAKEVTREEAEAALRDNRETLVKLFAGAIERGDGRIKGMPRRVIQMMAYFMQHDAHHRGQITRQLSEVGHKLAADETTTIWGWRKLPVEDD
ncbi:MAG TPA: DinB family protein [Trueperaceae bacterium]|nr:DinB family protein [Trueperaceae bacterium]